MRGRRGALRAVAVATALVMSSLGLGVDAPARADAPAVTITSPAQGATVSGVVGVDFEVTAPPGEAVAWIAVGHFTWQHQVAVDVPPGGCASTCSLHADVPTDTWVAENWNDGSQPSSNVPDGPGELGVCVGLTGGVSFCPGHVQVVFDNARPVLTMDPTGVPPYAFGPLRMTSVTGQDSYTFGYTATAAPGHEADPAAQPASVTVRNDRGVMGTGSLDSGGHGTFTWDTSALPNDTYLAVLYVTAAGGAPSALTREMVTVDHGQAVSLIGAPEQPVPFGWSGPVSMSIPFGPPSYGDPVGCPTTTNFIDVTYPALLSVSVDGAAARTRSLGVFDSYLNLPDTSCWRRDHDLAGLLPALPGGHHVIVVSEIDNRGVTSSAAPLAVDVLPAPAALSLTAPSLVASGQTQTLTTVLSSVAPTQGVPVTFAFRSSDESDFQDVATVVTDATGRAELQAPATQSGTWMARSAATADALAATAQVAVTVDAKTSWLTSASSGPSVVAALGTSTVAFSYAGADDVRVGSYDVAVRKASLGTGLSASTYPTAWQRTATRRVSTSVVGGGQTCFAARVRDLVGHVSAWSAWHCNAAPVDDRRGVRSATGTRLVSSSSALGGTLTRLAAGGTMTLTSQTNRRLGVCLLAGPGQGAVDVYVGRLRVARLSAAASTWHRQVLIVPGGAGVVTLRGASGTSLIDGVAFLRV